MVAMVLSGLLLAGCEVEDDSDTIRAVMHADLQSLDPIVTTMGIVQRHALLVYDTLFARDAEQRPQPQMVETWTVSEDGTEWTFTLRPGLLFHDGTPVTAIDVVASLERWGARDAYGRQMLAITENLGILDDRTVRWKLSRPFGLMLQALSKTGGPIPVIMPERLARTDPSTPVREVIGSGPFEFVAEQWVPGGQVVYRRFADYRPRPEPASGTAGGKHARVERVEWLNIRDPQSAVLALAAGEIDLVENPAVEFLPLLRREGLQITRTDPLGTQGMLRMNHLHPPFDDPRARQALLYAIDQAEILQAMFGDPAITQVCHAFFVCGSPLASSAGVPAGIGNDPERARALLAESGYDGRPIITLHPTDILFMNIATLVLAEQLRDVGFNIELVAMDFGTLAARRSNRAAPEAGGWHLGLTYWPGINIADPVGNIMLHASCERAWPGWPCDADHQALIGQFAAVTSDEQRLKLAEAIQQSAYELVPYVLIGQWTLPIATSPRIEGLLETPGTTVFWNLDKQPRS
ncbi:MAG: ABC transporter substrate-binding protein [Wenzhouxiangellaceae bacterium]|nr:ABC transporter substrate-binding protein [Wenzhouxiangellaceae bacterium]